MSTSEESKPVVKQEPERRTPVPSENTKSTQESTAPTTTTSSTSTSAINLKDAKVRLMLSVVGNTGLLQMNSVNVVAP